jgi:hypothetical protein
LAQEQIVRNFLTLIAAALIAQSACADSSITVKELVKQLGDAKFAVREEAQRELLKRGEEIVPELDKLAKGVDAETAERLRKVSYELVGYKDDIRRLLAGVHEGKDSAPAPISVELRSLIAHHQPGAADLLLSILSNPKNASARQALRTFIATWDSATPDQIDAYIQQVVTWKTNHRSKFPAKVGAMISFDAQIRDGWTGWPPIGDKKTEFPFRGRTIRHLDGKPYEKPFDYPYPFGTLGWYKVGEMAEGKHTIRAVLEYEFTHRGEKRKGRIESAESKFEVLPPDTPDDLIATKSDALTKRVCEVFKVRENDFDPKAFTGYQLGTLPAQGAEYQWYPQVTWKAGPTDSAGLHCPVAMMSGPLLDVDLCFEAEIHDLKTGTVYPADPIVVHRGNQGGGHIIPRDPQAFAKGREGFVKVKVVLKPSRAVALTHVDIKNYYPGTITSDELRMKVFPKVEPIP